MRVAHVHRMRGIGGSERHLLTLLPALTERGIDAVFVGLDDPAWDPADFYSALTVPAMRIPAPRDLDPLLLARLLRDLDADVVHTHLVHADLYGGVAGRLRGARLVSTKHNDDPFRSGRFRHVERALSRLADRIVTISDSLRRFTVERVGLPAAKVETIHYGLDDPPAAWGQNPPDNVPEDATILLSTSRLTRQKGVDVAVRALTELPAPTVLVVLGDGPEREPLGALATSLGVADRVFLLGRVPDVSAWLRRAAVYVHPARWEGFGLAVLEAMVCAVPVVATNVSSLPELVADGDTGVLVPPDDSTALARGIARALAEPQLGAAGRERARREFSVWRMADRTVAVYDNLERASS
ncbi:MAG TPA: glycosyltransferase family 4 protein [Gaiellaceae bacterium]|nr:glycosyltransferase family 4 protein [Gaiellaceae bacterium]